MASLSASATAGAPGTQATETIVASFQTDLPSISDAMKSYVSACMAQDLTKDKTVSIVHRRGSGETVHTQTVPEKPHNPTHFMTCARVALKHVNEASLPSMEDWRRARAAGAGAGAGAGASSETGTQSSAAAEEEYGVALVLLQKVKAAGGKPTKLFGRRFLRVTRVWDAAATAASEELIGAHHLPTELVEPFLRGFGKTISPRADTNGTIEDPSAPGVDANGAAASAASSATASFPQQNGAGGQQGGVDDGAAGDLAGLVWARDLKGALKQRQSQRTVEVRQRNARMADTRNEFEALKAMVHGAEDEVAETSPPLH